MKQSLKMLSKFLTAVDTEEKSIIFIINTEYIKSIWKMKSSFPMFSPLSWPGE